MSSLPTLCAAVAVAAAAADDDDDDDDGDDRRVCASVLVHSARAAWRASS
jgi:hypothetical protein